MCLHAYCIWHVCHYVMYRLPPSLCVATVPSFSVLTLPVRITMYRYTGALHKHHQHLINHVPCEIESCHRMLCCALTCRCVLKDLLPYYVTCIVLLNIWTQLARLDSSYIFAIQASAHPLKCLSTARCRLGLGAAMHAYLYLHNHPRIYLCTQCMCSMLRCITLHIALHDIALR